jgi:hypothetical protein
MHTTATHTHTAGTTNLGDVFPPGTQTTSQSHTEKMVMEKTTAKKFGGKVRHYWKPAAAGAILWATLYMISFIVNPPSIDPTGKISGVSWWNWRFRENSNIEHFRNPITFKDSWKLVNRKTGITCDFNPGSNSWVRRQ